MLKKFYIFLFIFLFICSNSFSKMQPKSKLTPNKNKIGLEAGFNIVNLYAIGKFSDYAIATVGCDIFVNLIFPNKKTNSFHLGLNADLFFSHVFQSGNYADKVEQKILSLGIFFLYDISKKIQLKPQFNFGVFVHSFDNAYYIRDSYVDLLFSTYFDIRYLFKYNIIFNASPYFCFSPTKGGVISFLGLKFGACYHF